MQGQATLEAALVRPHLEYASSVWNPSAADNIKQLEKVQQRAVRIGQQKTTYENRLKNTNLTTHQASLTRRLHRHVQDRQQHSRHRCRTGDEQINNSDKEKQQGSSQINV